MSFDLAKKKCFVFDAYGTLFRVDTSLSQLDLLSDSQKRSLLDIWRIKLLEYTWLRSLIGRYCPFELVVEEALRYALKTNEISEEEKILEAFMNIYLSPTLTIGARSLLQHLSAHSIMTAILSNGSEEMLSAGVVKCEIKSLLDDVISVERVGIFKPSPIVYNMVQDRLERDLQKVVFVSANFWDISGASSFGLDCIWINARFAIRDELPHGNIIEANGLDKLLALLND